MIAVSTKVAIGALVIIMLIAVDLAFDLIRHFVAGNFTTGWYTFFFFIVAVLGGGVILAFRFALLREIENMNEKLRKRQD